MNRIRVALFRNRSAALPSWRHLVQAGIPAEIQGEPAFARFWFVPKREACVRLEVPADDSERSNQLLLESEMVLGPLLDAIRCPECGSLRIDYPQFTEKSIFANIVAGLLAECRLLEREYYCQDCHYAWTNPRARPPRLRRHSAPNYFIRDWH